MLIKLLFEKQYLTHLVSRLITIVVLLYLGALC